MGITGSSSGEDRLFIVSSLFETLINLCYPHNPFYIQDYRLNRFLLSTIIDYYFNIDKSLDLLYSY